MRLVLALLMLALYGVPAVAQTSLLPGQRFGFDYAEADLAAFAVDRFEAQLDGGTWTAIGIPPAEIRPDTEPGKRTHVVNPPAMLPGRNHSLAFRACNSIGCSPATAPLIFDLVIVPPVVTGARILPPTP